MREALHFVDQHRVALLGDEQPLAYRIVSQPLKTLVAAHVYANGHLLGVCTIEEGGVLLQMNLDQSLLTLIRDHVGVGTDEFHRLRIAEASQRHTPQNLALKGQLDQLGVFVGDSEQAFALRIERQRRDVIVQPVDHPCFDVHPVLIQADGHTALRLPKGMQVEPGTFEQAHVLHDRNQHDQRNH
ncbi:hypothetical protein D3C85_1316080 [compost metagenome]